MSTLNVSKIQHESGAGDNINLDPSGNVEISGDVTATGRVTTGVGVTFPDGTTQTTAASDGNEGLQEVCDIGNFTTTDINVGNTVDDPRITLESDGSVTASSFVDSGSPNGDDDSASGVRTDGQGQVVVQRPSTEDDSLKSLVVLSGSTETAVISKGGDIQCTSQNSGQLAGFRNQLINGDFRIFQRGANGYNTSSSICTYGSVDRWGILDMPTGNHLAVGSAVPAGFIYSVQIDQQAESTIRQRIELVNRIAGPFFTGSTWTLSVWSSAQIRARVQDSDVHTFLPMANMTATSETSNGFTRYVATFTLGENASGDFLEVALQNQTGSAINVTGCQLEIGPVCTPFEHRPIATELALAQRYYVQGSLGLSGGIGADGNYAVRVAYPVQMRANATCTWTTTSTSGGGTFNGNVNGGGTDSLGLTIYGNQGGAAVTATGDWTASAEL